jgi:hypothetical protein
MEMAKHDSFERSSMSLGHGDAFEQDSSLSRANSGASATVYGAGLKVFSTVEPTPDRAVAVQCPCYSLARPPRGSAAWFPNGARALLCLNSVHLYTKVLKVRVAVPRLTIPSRRVLSIGIKLGRFDCKQNKKMLDRTPLSFVKRLTLIRAK